MLESGKPNPLWFALQVRPRHEKTVAQALRSKGLEDFCPQYIAVRRWSDRIKKLEAPLFPRYVFCRFDLHDKLKVLTTPGVVSLLGINHIPLPVADAEIAALQTIIQSHLPAQPWPFLQIGELVRLEWGPLAGLEGTLLYFKNQYRLVVSVTLLQRSVGVEIERGWVVPTGASRTRRASGTGLEVTGPIAFASLRAPAGSSTSPLSEKRVP